MIATTIKYKQGNTITYWSEGVHTSAGLIADLLSEEDHEITEIVIDPNDETDLRRVVEQEPSPGKRE